ncbi:MAG: aminotransferase class V-fold PLP-dependent enzyme [Planctomycetes bacterium]|nr:aminotransferase class V-fold PLP-dependent enzyme [Planctomycetota bacterium]
MSTLRDLWSLDPQVRFLNHGSFGAAPRVVLEEQQAWRVRLERQPVKFMAREAEGLLDAARGVLGEFVGADSCDLAFLPNATHGLNTILRSLKFSPGDEILTTSHGYNAARTAATFACDRARARVVEVTIPFPISGPEAVCEAVAAGFSERTRLLLIDHITSPSGLVFPIAELVALAHERGIEVLVDGAHAPGMIPLDLSALNADYYTGNCHKWLCSPKGAAFLHVRRDRQAKIRPLAISHGANDESKGRSRFRLEFDWTGSADPSSYLCVPGAIHFLGELFTGGWDALYAHNRALALSARKQMADALEVEVPAPDSMIGNLAAVTLPRRSPLGPRESDPLQVWLREVHRIEIPVVSFPGGRVIRMAAQAYVIPDEVDALAGALRVWRAEQS